MNPKQFARLREATKDDIFAFCRLMRFEPTRQQRQLLQAVQDGIGSEEANRIACRSGQGPGKTTVTSIIVLWRLWRRKNHRVIITAPTMRQCKEVFLAEVERVLSRAPALMRRYFRVTNTTIGVMGQKAKIWGALTITATKSENAQGQHGESMDVVLEEASGVSRDMVVQFKGTLSNPNSLFLMIGNPNTRDCAFFDAFEGPAAHKWKHLAWNAEETPKSRWFDPARNEELAEEFGRESDIYRVRVLGEFPRMDPDCMMSSDDVLYCMRPEMKLEMARRGRDKAIGLDFARHGGDESVAMQRAGMAIVDWGIKHRCEPSVIVDSAIAMQHRRHWRDRDTIFVCDANGIGEGVVGKLYDAGKDVFEFKSQRKAQRRYYANMITEAWWNLARLVRERRCYLPHDRQLLQQLTSRKYTTDSKGLLVIEKKDDYMKRGYPSPDRADAVVMAFYPGTAGRVGTPGLL